MKTLASSLLLVGVCLAVVITTSAYKLHDKESLDFEPESSSSNVEVLHHTDCKCQNGLCVKDLRGKTKCICKPRHVLQKEGVCKECYCGLHGNCYFQQHSNTYLKKCLCEQGFAEKDEKCIACQCGVNSKCEFEGNHKICYCLEGYAELKGVCTECNCGDFGECEFKHGKKQCNCYENFIEQNGQCVECNCGEFGECEFKHGKKKCNCYKNFLEQNGQCVECNCGEFGECEFKHGKKKCNCYENFLEQNGHCVECDCGNGTCSYKEDRKVCECWEGFALNDSRCEACDCGRYSTYCAFTMTGRKACSCQRGFAQKDGYCKACDCGVHSYGCSFDSYGKKNCRCQKGFFENDGECMNCSCGDKMKNCSFKDGKKVCTCVDGYTPIYGICTAVCYKNEECQHGSECSGEEGRKVCKCKKGLRGDYCEVIDDCKRIGQSCHNSGGICKYDAYIEQAYCECPPGKPWNPVDLKCKDCDCGPYTESCKFDSGGNKLCTCQWGFAQLWDLCAFCNCGKNSESCSFHEDKNQICQCKEGYAQKGQICAATCTQDYDCQHGGQCLSEAYRRDNFCKCKPGLAGDRCDVIVGCKEMESLCKAAGVNCSYNPESEKAYCQCPGKKVFNTETKKCQEICYSSEDCFNGGKCERIGDANFCKCGKDLKGDRCENIVGCHWLEPECSESGGQCSYDLTKQSAFCYCPPGLKLNVKTKKCQKVSPCDPDPCVYGTCIPLGTDFRCSCIKPYTGRYCEICSCIKTVCWGGRCRVHDDGIEECICPTNYALKNGTCRKDRCTDKSCVDGKCEVVGDKEVCSCYEGYVLEGDVCKKLTCSQRKCVGGTCIVRAGNVEDCICPSGFRLQGDTCIQGPCLPSTCFGGRCEKVEGQLTCVCPKGYRLEGVGCFAIVCKETNCFGGVCQVIDGEEICTCSEGYVLKNDVCEKIRCMEKTCFGGRCDVVEGKEVCICPSGFSLGVDDVCRKTVPY